MSPQPQSRGSAPIVPPRLSAADMLRALADASDGENISVDEILAALGNHSFGLLILVLALPNAIPGPIIPGFSVPFALGIILLSIQIS
ncbi:MAG TPA: exopolysaccharide biosynthesis protein, partial [Stellaceae bacterium]|nr:exopolysaccharide biosynthesis protein [Stellaceae bacterium]